MEKKRVALARTASAMVLALAAAALLAGGSAPLRADDTAIATATAAVPLFDGLGAFTRKVTTTSPEAQRYFDQGLVLLLRVQPRRGDPRRSADAAELDPTCAMA